MEKNSAKRNEYMYFLQFSTDILDVHPNWNQLYSLRIVKRESETNQKYKNI